ncbi:MAG: M28 family peptidase [Xanthomonadales bacterium]|nr:M28 family peptidase [Gammaproteobacteria bacterium]NNE04896.1 M28 family peptidase [Xanthomonadales bacterium]NNL96209.1 M28 family peptidase [Xanthomonadales bacterium]
MSNFSAGCLALLWLAAPALVHGQQNDDHLLEARLRAHIEFLASDKLAGREPGTAGYDIAADYVASQFRQVGLQAAGDNGSYFQQVPLRSAVLKNSSARLHYSSGRKSRDFRFVKDFFMGPDVAQSESKISGELVFAGYGIEAPELDYNDFASIDVTGKIIVVLAGQPLDFPSEEGAHFGSGREKRAAWARNGAIGAIVISTPRRQRRSAWERVQLRVGKPSMKWLQPDGRPFPDNGSVAASASLHHEPARVLFESAPFSLDELIELDESGQGLPVFELEGEISMAQQSVHRELTSPNVVGVLPGTDPTLSDEYVVYIGHLDHIGELAGEGHADKINNGALDNASGISVMIETARMFASNGAPRRSLMFLALTAEEKGLVGSEYFANYPTIPKQSMAAVINLDMPVLLYEFGDVIAFGAEHSTLKGAFEQAAGEFGVSLTPDPFPEQNIFVRSDHYRFVQQGIPSVFLVTGPSSLDNNIDTKPIYEGFLKEHYHRVSDDLNLPINYTAAARFTRINARAGALTANQAERPRWLEGDFFGDTFGR